MTTQVTGSGVNFNGSTSGTILLTQPAVAGSNTITLPAETGTLRTNVSSGSVLQTVIYQTGALATGSTQIPTDDTIPQITEGVEFMTLAITPKSATSKLRIQARLFGCTNSGAGSATGALFRDSGADALAADMFTFTSTGYLFPLTIDYTMDSPGTSSTTFRVRAGPNTAIAYVFNGSSSGVNRYFGGVANSYIKITEYVP